MGYYTDYTLTFDCQDVSKYYEICDFFEKTTDFDLKMLRSDLKNKNVPKKSEFQWNSKWYDHEEDMIKISKKFPDIVFYLHGEGEEKEDIWKLIAYQGMIEKVMAEINFPSFQMKI